MGTKNTKCIVCGGRKFNTYSEELVQCSDCSFVIAKEVPTLKEINDIYQKEYFFGMEYFDYKADRIALERNFKARIKSLKYMINPNDKIIEIGCAYGYFLNLIKDKVAYHIGFDVTKDGVDYAKKQFGLNATTKDFIEYDIKDNSIDSIFMWDVVEHLVQPDKYIEKISKVLKKDGRVVLTTGDIGALVARIRKGNWRMIHPPTHIYYFSPKTIQLLLKKYGLEIERVRHTSISRNVGSVFNQIIINRKATNKNVKIHTIGHFIAKKIKFDKVNIPVNTFDIMEVVARKV